MTPSEICKHCRSENPDRVVGLYTSLILSKGVNLSNLELLHYPPPRKAFVPNVKVIYFYDNLPNHTGNWQYNEYSERGSGTCYLLTEIEAPDLQTTIEEEQLMNCLQKSFSNVSTFIQFTRIFSLGIMLYNYFNVMRIFTLMVLSFNY